MLRAAFCATGFGVAMPLIGRHFGLNHTLQVQMAFCLPAVMLGAASYWVISSFARSWPVAACLLVIWGSLLYARPVESSARLIILASVSVVPPIAALIVENRCWRLCARTYVLGNTLAFGWIIWATYRANDLMRTIRLGLLIDDEGDKLANPNFVGAQFAEASLLALVLYMTCRDPKRRTALERWMLPCSIVLALGCMLTASRSAFVAWFAGVLLLMLWARKDQQPSRLRDLVGLGFILLGGLVFASAAFDLAPWRSLQDRLAQREKLESLSGRSEVWRNSYTAWRSERRYIWLGTGTGAAAEVLGRFDDLARRNEQGVLWRSTHSTYVEWGLSYGLMGLPFGLWLLASVWIRAHRLDRREGQMARRAILLCVCLLSATMVIYTQRCFLATGSLILAMLSEPRGSGPRHRAATRGAEKEKTAVAAGDRPRQGASAG